MRALLILLAILSSSLALGQRDSGPPSTAVKSGGITPRTARDIARIEDAVRRASTPKEAATVIPPDLFGSPPLKERLVRMGQGNEKARADALVVLSALRLAAETKPDEGALAKVREIKSRAEYRTAKAGTASTWFGRTIEGFTRWLEGLLKKLNMGGPNINTPNMPDWSLPSWLIYVVWVLIAAVVIACAWPLIRLIRFRIARRQRKAKGLLEEEPERSRSEYLSLADALAAQGDFRGAIRMSYLAALKRFDEARVARFDRGETNWEHLARIRASATLPVGLDFRPATAAFDHYWYGKRPAHQADYERFVGWYDEVDTALRRGMAV